MEFSKLSTLTFFLYFVLHYIKSQPYFHELRSVYNRVKCNVYNNSYYSTSEAFITFRNISDIKNIMFTIVISIYFAN